jgi:hypothetical protein
VISFTFLPLYRRGKGPRSCESFPVSGDGKIRLLGHLTIHSILVILFSTKSSTSRIHNSVVMSNIGGKKYMLQEPVLSKHISRILQVTTEPLLLTDPPTDRFSTLCNQGSVSSTIISRSTITVSLHREILFSV